MPRVRRGPILSDPRLGTPSRGTAAPTTATPSQTTPRQVARCIRGTSRTTPNGQNMPRQTARCIRGGTRLRGIGGGRGTGSLSNGQDVMMDTTTLADSIKQLAADLSHPSTGQTGVSGGDDAAIADLKTKCQTIVEKLSALVVHDPNKAEEKAKARNTLLAEALSCVSETFNIESQEYGELVWQSPQLISSMQVLLVIYLSYMPLYEPDHAADTVVCFAVDLLERFDSVQWAEPESKVISLAAIYLRIYYAYNNNGVMVDQNIAKTLFSLLLKFTDNYIWQGEPFEFLKTLPNLYKLVNLKCCYAQHLNEIIDYLQELSTKEVLKALYADTIVFGPRRLMTYNDNRNNKSIDLINQKFEDWVSFGAGNSVDLSCAREMDRSIDIICQVITCNNRDYKVLFPSYELVEVYIIPLLYDGIPIFLKLRACHFLVLWLQSFLYRPMYGPSRDAVMCSLVDILFNRFEVDKNISVRFAIARCLNSIFENPTSRDIALGASVTSTSRTRVVCELIRTFSQHPYEGSPALAANSILHRHPHDMREISEEIIELLLDLLDRVCKRLQFFHIHGFNVNNNKDKWTQENLYTSVISTLLTLEVAIKAAAVGKALHPEYDLDRLEIKVVNFLKFIYTNMMSTNMKICAAAFQLQITLGSLKYTEVSSTQLDSYAQELSKRIKDLTPDELLPDFEDLVMNLGIWNIRLARRNIRPTPQ